MLNRLALLSATRNSQKEWKLIPYQTVVAAFSNRVGSTLKCTFRFRLFASIISIIICARLAAVVEPFANTFRCQFQKKSGTKIRDVCILFFYTQHNSRCFLFYFAMRCHIQRAHLCFTRRRLVIRLISERIIPFIRYSFDVDDAFCSHFFSLFRSLLKGKQTNTLLSEQKPENQMGRL